MNAIVANETHDAAMIIPTKATSNPHISLEKLRGERKSPNHGEMLGITGLKNGFMPPIAKLSTSKKHHAPSKIKTLGPYDILCGRTSTAFNNIGNRRFRMTISFNLKRYLDAPTRSEKSVVIWSIVKLLREDVGARFLKTTKNGYVELSEKKMREKVGHALRDMAMAEHKAAEQKPVYEAWAERALQASLGNLHVMFHQPSSSTSVATETSALSPSSITPSTVHQPASENDAPAGRDYYSADDDVSSDGSWDPLPLAASSNDAVKNNNNRKNKEDTYDDDGDESIEEQLMWGISSRHSV